VAGVQGTPYRIPLWGLALKQSNQRAQSLAC
jgi:hypothetical protein